MAVPRNVVLLLALALIAGLSVMQAGEARKNGVSGRALGGCTPCHGNAAPWSGVAGQLPLTLSMEGVPDEYEPGTVYELELSVAGGFPYLKAGFNLNATAGSLSVPDDEGNVQITTKDTFGGVPGEATHKTPDSRAWKVDWTAPREGAGPVAFFLAMNSVNGNDQPDAADQWNLLTAGSAEKNFAPRAPLVVLLRDNGLGAVTVNWTPSPDLDIVRHELYAGTEGFKPGSDTLRVTVENATAQELLASGLEPATEYEFVLRAVDKGGLAADSAPAPFRLAPDSSLGNVTSVQPTTAKESPAAAAGLGALAVLAAVVLARRQRQ